MITFEKLQISKNSLYFLVLDEMALSPMHMRESIKGIFQSQFLGQTNWDRGSIILCR